MTPEAIKRLLIGALMLVLIGAGAYGVWSYKNLATKAARLDAVEAQLVDIKNQQAVLNTELLRRSANDTTIRSARAATTQRLETVADEDPAAADYLSTVIPDSVRNAYRRKR